MSWSIWIRDPITGELVDLRGKSILQEVVAIAVTTADAAEHAVELPSIGGANTIVPHDDSPGIPGDGGGEVMTARIDGGELKYQAFGAGLAIQVRGLLF